MVGEILYSIIMVIASWWSSEEFRISLNFTILGM